MENSLLIKATYIFKQYWLIIILAGLGLIFFVYGLMSLLGTSQNQNNQRFESDSNIKQDHEDTSDNLIAVDVEGEVSKPGVYKIRQDSILQDALVASGGLSNLADRNWIAKYLNLASRISDGQKIYIPKQGESDQSVLNASTQSSPNSSPQGGIININSASSKELDSLPGVGPVTSEKIINNRPYNIVDDLVSKKVVSQKVFDEIKDKIIAQ